MSEPVPAKALVVDDEPNILASGRAAGLLDGLVTSYKFNDRADAAAIDAEAKTLRELLRTRTESLASDAAIAGGQGRQPG
jgi:hypothetical protein